MGPAVVIVRLGSSDSEYRADNRAVEAAIGPDTIMLVGSAPSYPFGANMHRQPCNGHCATATVIYALRQQAPPAVRPPSGGSDALVDFGRLAGLHNLWLHVDACNGGMVFPFTRMLGRPTPTFDFELPHVRSCSRPAPASAPTAQHIAMPRWTAGCLGLNDLVQVDLRRHPQARLLEQRGLDSGAAGRAGRALSPFHLRQLACRGVLDSQHRRVAFGRRSRVGLGGNEVPGCGGLLFDRGVGLRRHRGLHCPDRRGRRAAVWQLKTHSLMIASAFRLMSCSCPATVVCHHRLRPAAHHCAITCR